MRAELKPVSVSISEMFRTARPIAINPKSSRAIIFSKSGKKLISSQLEFKQFFPKNGWVEHNPKEIWSTTIKVTKNVLLKSKKLKINIKALGITNQRETTVCWDKRTGEPVYNAIVWQDRRTEGKCKIGRAHV